MLGRWVDFPEQPGEPMRGERSGSEIFPTMKDATALAQVEGSAPSSPLMDDLHQHVSMMAPHQRDRRAGKLLIAATDEIERLRVALRVIADFAGTTEGECGVTCNASWCAEQARAALWPWHVKPNTAYEPTRQKTTDSK